MVQVETLMIGDWVEVTLKGKTMPVQVSSLNSTFMSYTTDGENGHIAHSGEMNPITITDKVLEQIASYITDGEYWAMDWYKYVIDVRSREDVPYCFFYPDYESLLHGFSFCSFSYVHELQHLLRVIGKGKLADKILLW